METKYNTSTQASLCTEELEESWRKNIPILIKLIKALLQKEDFL
jgi:hypothetical protein